MEKVHGDLKKEVGIKLSIKAFFFFKVNKVSKSTHIKQSILLNSVTFLAYETYECVTGLCCLKIINSQNV